jgi:Zn-dependent protease with chaperone function
MSALTVSELEAILAHEYAHFSRQDTYYSRFIHRVTLSIQQADSSCLPSVPGLAIRAIPGNS